MISQFPTLLAMTNPAAGAAGGIIFLVLFGIGPISFVLHLATRRFVLTWFGVSGAFTLFLLVVVLIFDWHVPERLFFSLYLVFMGGGMSLVMSFLTGLSVVIGRLWIARIQRKRAF